MLGRPRLPQDTPVARPRDHLAPPQIASFLPQLILEPSSSNLALKGWVGAVHVTAWKSPGDRRRRELGNVGLLTAFSFCSDTGCFCFLRGKACFR